MTTAVLLVAAWGAFTIGVTMIAGGLPGPVAQWWPALADMVPLRAGLVLFVLGSAVIVSATYALAVLASRPSSRRA